LHTLCNNNLVYYRTSEKRGDVPTDLQGVVVHDHFQSYFSKMKGVAHAMCNAHHLRELKAISEIDKEPWAKHLSRLLLLAGKNKIDGANAFFAARSYTTTAQKQTFNIIDAISHAFDGKPLLLT
jgi:hypothetical protein